MKMFEWLYKDKYIKFVHIITFLMLCGTRLAKPASNEVFILFLFSMVIFTILPIGMWFYFQKTTALFHSCYVRVRLRDLKFNCYFLNVLVNDVIVILYVLLNASIIFFLTFDFNEMMFIVFFIVITLYWLCIYLLFVGIFHLIYYVTSEIKNAFFSSYIFLIFLTFATGFLSPNLFMYENFDFAKLSFLIFVSVMLIVLIHSILFLLSRRKCEVYDKDKI